MLLDYNLQKHDKSPNPNSIRVWVVKMNLFVKLRWRFEDNVHRKLKSVSLAENRAAILDANRREPWFEYLWNALFVNGFLVFYSCFLVASW